jgi:uncharacterized Zn-finger protein
MHKCNRCSKKFTYKSDYTRHKNRKTICLNDSQKSPDFKCQKCNKPFSSKSNLTRHINGPVCCKTQSADVVIIPIKIMQPIKTISPIIVIKQDNSEITCEYCDKIFTRKQNLKRHTDHRCKYKKQIDKYNERYESIEQLTDEITEIKTKMSQYEIKITKDMAEMKKTIDKLLSDKIKAENKSKNPPKRKQIIPAIVKNTIWGLHCNGVEDKCFCCNQETITRGNFETGHIVSEKNNGKIELPNLRPICGLCNKSMGSQNMTEFMKKYGYANAIRD